MATETIVVDGIVTQTNWSGTLGQIDNTIASADGVTTEATADNQTHRYSFGTPTGDPRTGTDLQTFRIHCGKADSLNDGVHTSGGGDPTIVAELRETSGGSALESLGTLTVPDSAIGTIEFTWDAVNLGTSNGSAVELYFTTSKAGGGPNSRWAIIDEVEWLCDYSVGGTFTKTADMDAYIQSAGETKTANLDAYVQSQGETKTASLDALVQSQGETATTDLDALVQSAGETKTTDMDAVVQAVGETKTTSLDAVLEPEVYITDSTNIGVSGANTTVQLAAPGGKTTGDFGGGRIQDDENPTDDVDLAADEYREDEWALKIHADVAGSTVYQFRVVLDDDSELDTYSVTPQITVGAAATYTKTTDLDAYIQAQGELQTANLDAHIQAAGLTQTADMDAIVKALGETATASLDAYVAAVGETKTADMDALLQAVRTATANLDAYVQAQSLTKTVAMDALVARLGLLKTLAMDAVLQAVGVTGTADLDAIIQAQGLTATLDLDAILATLISGDAGVDASLMLSPRDRAIALARLRAVDLEARTDSLAPSRGRVVTVAPRTDERER